MDRKELISKLKNTNDIAPDNYDGSYELVREIVNSYSNVSNTSLITSKDLDAIYSMALGTWRMSVDKKKEYISDGILPELEKQRLYDLIDDVWDKACTKKYSYCEMKDKPSIGMFGTGFFRFKISNENARKFIGLLTQMKDWSDESSLHLCEEVFTNNMKGIAASAASIILHCYKPYVFPIINGNMGNDNIYEYLGIVLEKPKELTTYIKNCKAIQEFRDNNFKFKNYRIFDYEARFINKDNNEYWPSYEEYDPQISVEQWLDLLNDQTLFGPIYKGVLAAFYKHGPISCSELDKKFDKSKEGSFRSWVIQIAKHVQNKTSRPYMLKEDNKPCYWPILFVGRNPKDGEIGSWIYKLRDELYEALTQYNILDYLWEYKVNYWLYEPGDKAVLWDEVYKKNIIKLSSNELTNLNAFNTEEEINQVLTESETFDGSISNVATQSYCFAKIMKPGDIIYVRTGRNTILGRGQVMSDYSYDLDDYSYPHQRRVSWTDKGEWSLYVETAFIKELTLIDDEKHKAYLEKLNKLFDGGETKMKELNKNIILYGPPGTGKTYNTVNYAVSIIEDKDISIIQKEDYTTVKQRYNEYLEKKQIQFTTFHQSYGYEDFIEGIKPQIDENENVTYKLENGVFKTFCEDSKIVVSELEDLGLNMNPSVWKMSLQGAGDNPIRTECMENEHIRISWDEWGEDPSTFPEYAGRSGSIIRAFISNMQIGDIVLSCYSSKTIDAIGVITGDYEWHPEYTSYKRVRKVKWLVKGINENILSINHGHIMTLAPVYRMSIKISDVLDLIKKYKEPYKVTNKKPYVFIIDEINRGNISKIFGELITLIETSKRDGEIEATKVILPYSKDSFSVPNNIYILGTMNTADRSIALMDTALRRRFNFVEMMPDSNVLNGVEVGGLNVSKMLDVINDRITFLYDREHTIGHAFFMPLKNEPSIKKLSEIFKNKLIPLLQEYFYEDYEKIRLVLGDNGKSNDKFKFIKDVKIEIPKLFKGNIEDELDISNVKYEVNEEALSYIESYKEII